MNACVGNGEGKADGEGSGGGGGEEKVETEEVEEWMVVLRGEEEQFSVRKGEKRREGEGKRE